MSGVVHSTLNDLPKKARGQIIDALNVELAGAIDFQLQTKQAHWNVKGPAFIALHKLFDEISEEAEEYVDLIAERIVQLGGVAEGTRRAVADRSKLPDYPMTIASSQEHVAALSTSIAAFGARIRKAIDRMNKLGDADAADICTEISRGLDKWLWFVESHAHA